MPTTADPQALLNAMPWRCIGPSRGGRVVAVAGHPVQQATFYFGAVAGGVWKTDDAGITWRCISDQTFKTASVGALALSDSDPNVLYAGMGETTIRTDVSYGDGVYKSTDGGQTWRHLGLQDTRHIGQIRIHPTNPDIVYVAALGHAFGSNSERGVYRSRDGGATWQQVLFKSDKAGAVDLALDTQNPDILYASFWQTIRNFWSLSSGGPDSSLWKSTDGGDTWIDLGEKTGFASGLKGKIGVAASPVQAGRVWAIVEAKEKPGLYLSDDFGETWALINDEPNLRQRPWYYCHIFADPVSADTVYVNNLSMWKSTDGGKHFDEIATPHGDNHALWIDPHNNQRMIQGNDGGACISFNGGRSFTTIYNQLTAQFYHLDVDDCFPYNVYGTQQDNSSICVPSDSISGAISWANCHPAGTGESGYIAVDPQNPQVLYVGAVGSSPGGLGALQRYDHATGHIQLINVWPEAYGGTDPEQFKYRFPWTFPILFSPHDPEILYTCANVAFRSRDQGHSWEPFSPDLTRADPDKLKASGGPITLDTSGAEHYATISTFRECPHEVGLFWAGSDDGLVHISRDNGQTWQNVTPPDLPEWTLIRTLEPSPHKRGELYLAGTRYKLDDPAPYLYRTMDYGQTWHKIVSGLPDTDYIRVVRADPNHPGLLYAGSETGLYVSLNDGDQWQRWQSNLPIAPIYDMKVKDSDLILATHGRSFWILDDLTPLYQGAPPSPSESARLFQPRPTVRVLPDLVASWAVNEGMGYSMGLGTSAIFQAHKDKETGQTVRKFLDAGQGAPRGAIIYYELSDEISTAARVFLEIQDTGGNVIRTFSPKPTGYDGWSDEKKSLDTGPWIPAQAGINRFLWDLRYAGATRVAGNKTAGESLQGPFVVPGTYQVILSVESEQPSLQTQLLTSLHVINDPRIDVSQQDLISQRDLLLRIRDKISDAHQAINRLRDLHGQLKHWRSRLEEHGELAQEIDTILETLDGIEDQLILPGDQKNTYGLVQRPRLNAALASLISVVGSADAKPTTQAIQLSDQYSVAIDEQISAFDRLISEDIALLNQKILQAKIAPVAISSPVAAT